VEATKAVNLGTYTAPVVLPGDQSGNLKSITLPSAMYGLATAVGGRGLYRFTSNDFSTPSGRRYLENSPGNRLMDFDGRMLYNKVSAQNAANILSKIDGGEITTIQGAMESIVTRDTLTLRIRKTASSPEALRAIAVQRPDKPTAQLEENISNPDLIKTKLDKLYDKYRKQFSQKGGDFTPDDVYREIVAASGRPNNAMNASVIERLKMPFGMNAAGLRVAGRALGIAGLVYGAVTDSRSLYKQYQIGKQSGNFGNTYREGARIAGGWAGAFIVGEAGAAAGAYVGGLIGSVVPVLGTGVGAAVGGFIGGAIGGIVGYNAGSTDSSTIYQWISGE